MKKLFLFIATLLFVSVSYSQITQLHIPKKVSTASGSRVDTSVWVQYLNKYYYAGTTDTAEFFSHVGYDSIQYYVAFSDSVNAHFSIIVGENNKSNMVSSSHVDTCKIAGATGSFKGIWWFKLSTGAASPFYGSRLIIEVQSNAWGGYTPDYSATRLYSVYALKFKH